MESVFPESAGEPTGTAVTPPEPQSDSDMLRQLIAEQQQNRAEVASLRQELAQSKSASVVAQPATNLQTAEDLLAARHEEIGKHSHYCPGCGRLYDYLRECLGSPSAPHPPIQVIPTDELKQDDVSQHTAAPNTDKLG